MPTLMLVVLSLLLGTTGLFGADTPNVSKISAETDWARSRGADGDCKSPMKGIRTDWTGGLKKIWEVKGLSPDGCTWSAPSIQGNKLVVMGQRANPAPAKDSTDTVYCYDADKGGEPLWKQDFKDGYGDYGWGLGPTVQPTMDGDKVYVAGRDGTFLCLSMADGKVLWKSGGVSACHGYNANPLIWDDLIIVPGYKYEQWKYALLGALKKDTGEKVWIYGTTGGGEGAHYGNVSPARMKLDGKDQLVYSTGMLVCGLDARTGQPFWEHEIAKGWGANYTPCGPVAAWPFFYVTTSDSKPPIGLQFEQGKPKEVWRGFSGNKGKYFPSLSSGVVVDGYVYTFTNDPAGPDAWYFGGGFKGDLVCLDPKTGQVKWEQATGNGSMVVLDGHLLCLTYSGELLLVSPSPDGFKKVTEWKGAVAPHSWMMGGKELKKDPAPFWVNPVVARGKLYIRYDDTLTCFELVASAK